MTLTRFVTAVSAACLLALNSVSVGAHFKLLEPASWLVENNLGDPQKAAPCGNPPAPRPNATAPANAPTLPVSNVVGKAVGGSKLHLKVQETIYILGTTGLRSPSTRATNCRPIR